MIEVTWDGRVLRARGHAENDPRVCAALSGLAGTLFVSYDMPAPTEGAFDWDSGPSIGNEVIDFVLNFVRTLARQYPSEISLKEVGQSAA